MVEVELTVGKLDASLALLLTRDHHLVEFPTMLLPDGISPGSIVKLQCERDFEAEERSQREFDSLQEEIYNTFGKFEPLDPQLNVLNVTQTCCVLEWDRLNLGTGELKSLSLYKNGVRMANIKSPMGKRTIKFSGLPIDTPYKFQLKMDTSCGVYWSNMVEIKTHKMTDLTGITCCIGDIDYGNETFTREDIDNIIESIGANRISNSVKVDTTQFICTMDTGIQYQAALEANIPIVRPEWLKACQLERRIVGVNKFYLNSETPLWKERNFWAMEVAPVEETSEATVVKETIGNGHVAEAPVTGEGTEINELTEPVEETVTETSVTSPAQEEEVIEESEPVVNGDVTEAVVVDEAPVVEEPVEEPVVEEPVVEEPVVEEPVVEEPVVEEPAVEEPVVEEPVEEPAVEEPAIKVPVIEEPVEEPVEEPAVEEPAVEESAVEESAVEEPVSEEVEVPTVEESEPATANADPVVEEEAVIDTPEEIPGTAEVKEEEEATAEVEDVITEEQKELPVADATNKNGTIAPSGGKSKKNKKKNRK